MCFKNSKKLRAVSPLIATILLVAVSLSLAGILYSWSSNNAKETTTSMSKATTNWIDCSSVNIFIENGCTYDPNTGISLVLNDQSNVEIDNNLTMTVRDANNNIRTTSFSPKFLGRFMLVNTADSNICTDPTDFEDLEEPLKKVLIYVNSCPNKTTYTVDCD